MVKWKEWAEQWKKWVVTEVECFTPDQMECLLKCFTPPTTTWTEILVSPPPLAEGVLELQGHGGGGESGSDEEDQVTQEGTVQTPHKYPDHERRPTDHFSPEDYRRDIRPKKRGDELVYS